MRELYERMGAEWFRERGTNFGFWHCNKVVVSQNAVFPQSAEPNREGIKMAKNLIWTLESSARACEGMIANGDDRQLNARREEAEKYRSMLRNVGVEIPREIE